MSYEDEVAKMRAAKAAREQDEFAALWAPLAPPDAPPSNGTSTSRRAALAVLPHIGTQRRRVLDYLLRHGPMTEEALTRALGMNPNATRPRLKELRVDGLVEPDGEGTTASGHPARLYRATHAAHAAWYGAAA